MNEKAGSRDLDDEDIVDVDTVEIVSNAEEKKPAKTSSKKTLIKMEKEPDGPVARRLPADHIRPRPPPAIPVKKSCPAFPLPLTHMPGLHVTRRTDLQPYNPNRSSNSMASFVKLSGSWRVFVHNSQMLNDGAMQLNDGQIVQS